MIAFLAGSLSPWLLGRLREAFPAGRGLAIGFTAFALVSIFFVARKVPETMGKSLEEISVLAEVPA